MVQEVTRRRFVFQTLGVIEATMVAGDLLPLLAEAAKRKQVLRVAVERDFETLRADFSAGYTNNMLKRLIYTTPFLWGTKQRPDGSLIYDPDTIEARLVIANKVSEDRQTVEFTGYPRKAGHLMTSTTERHDRLAVPRSGQILDIR